jgi:putative hemolysin
MSTPGNTTVRSECVQRGSNTSALVKGVLEPANDREETTDDRAAGQGVLVQGGKTALGPPLPKINLPLQQETAGAASKNTTVKRTVGECETTALLITGNQFSSGEIQRNLGENPKRGQLQTAEVFCGRTGDRQEISHTPSHHQCCNCHSRTTPRHLRASSPVPVATNTAATAREPDT